MTVAISRLRVLELGNSIATEYCGKLFAGFGASVVHLNLSGPGKKASLSSVESRLSPDYAWYNTGKTSLAVDTGSASGRQHLAKLVDAADIVIESLGPGEFEHQLNSDLNGIRKRNPGIVIVRVSPFGQTGPNSHLSAEEITLYALSGAMNSTGDNKREPLNSQPRICSNAAGIRAFTAGLMGIYRRAKIGCGDVADLSVNEISLDLFETSIAEYFHLDKIPKRTNDDHRMVPWRSYRCKDGFAVIIGGPPRHWPKAAQIFGNRRLCTSEFAYMNMRIQKRKEVEELMSPWLMANDKLTIYHTAQANRLACSYLASLKESLESPQSVARESFIEIDQPGVGRLKIPDAPFRAESLEWQTHPAPAPATSSAGIDDIWQPRTGQNFALKTSRTPTLQGVRIIDFSVDWAGPHATRFLSDYGADVIKIEYPGCVDRMRGGFPPQFNQHPRIWHLHRNKRSVTLDLGIPEHLEACKALIRDADVVLENSRPGVMSKHGLSFDVLRETNPRLIYLAMSAFGATGPESSYAGYGGSIEAISGLQSLTGYGDSDVRYRVKEIDVTNGFWGAAAVMAALVQREVTGKGVWIDMSGRETTAWLAGEFYARYSKTGVEPGPIGNRHEEYAPQGCYPCRGDDRWMVLTVRSDDEWKALTTAMGDQELANDSRLRTAAGRREHHDLIDQHIRKWTIDQTGAEAAARLQTCGIPAAPVYDARDIANDAHLAARHYFLEAKEGKYPGYSFQFTDTDSCPPRKGPDFGEHNEELLGAVHLPRSVWPDLSPDKVTSGYYVSITESIDPPESVS